MPDVIELDDSNFDEVVATSDVPLLVDFTAAWCAPCRLMAPVIEQLAAENPGRMAFARLDVDHSPATARRLGVMSMPTFVLFVDGREERRLIGARPRHQFVREIFEPLVQPG